MACSCNSTHKLHNPISRLFVLLDSTKAVDDEVFRSKIHTTHRTTALFTRETTEQSGWFAIERKDDLLCSIVSYRSNPHSTYISESRCGLLCTMKSKGSREAEFKKEEIWRSTTDFLRERQSEFSIRCQRRNKKCAKADDARNIRESYDSAGPQIPNFHASDWLSLLWLLRLSQRLPHSPGPR